MVYPALANSWGEVSGRPRLPSSPAPGGSITTSISPCLSKFAYSQAAQVAAAPIATAEDLIRIAKQEEIIFMVELGMVADIF